MNGQKAADAPGGARISMSELERRLFLVLTGTWDYIHCPYSSGVERCTCKKMRHAKADSSNLSGGISFLLFDKAVGANF